MKKLKPLFEKTTCTTKFYCPSCHLFFGNSGSIQGRYQYINYCPQCGQPIIWNDVEFGVHWNDSEPPFERYNKQTKYLY